jgi:hypothetical protein
MSMVSFVVLIQVVVVLGEAYVLASPLDIDVEPRCISYIFVLQESIARIWPAVLIPTA